MRCEEQTTSKGGDQERMFSCPKETHEQLTEPGDPHFSRSAEEGNHCHLEEGRYPHLTLLRGFSSPPPKSPLLLSCSLQFLPETFRLILPGQWLTYSPHSNCSQLTSLVPHTAVSSHVSRQPPHLGPTGRRLLLAWCRLWTSQPCSAPH